MHYVGVGTCSLTASVSNGTNYARGDRLAQTFAIGQAAPTVSISNLPASGTYGGSFTPSIATNSDTGTTSFVSNSTAVCSVTAGVVHYVGVGTCSLTASVSNGTNYARGDRLGADLRDRPGRPDRLDLQPPRLGRLRRQLHPEHRHQLRHRDDLLRLQLSRSAASPRGSCTTSASAPARSPPR